MMRIYHLQPRSITNPILRTYSTCSEEISEKIKPNPLSRIRFMFLYYLLNFYYPTFRCFDITVLNTGQDVVELLGNRSYFR